MPRAYRRLFRVRQYECDLHGHVNNANYLRYMQQAATEASADVGYDPARYRVLGTVWLIRETGIEYLRPVRPEQVLEVHTWVADSRRVVSRRRYSMTVDGQPVAEAFTDWVYVDRATQLPVRIPAEMALAFIPEGGAGEAVERKPIEAPAPPAQPVRIVHHVEWGDLDSAGHVNNAIYLNLLEESGIRAGQAAGWGMERLAEQGLAVVARSHRIQYLRPALHGDELEVTTWLSSVRRVSAQRHYVVKRLSDESVLARAETRVAILWREDMSPAAMPEAMRQAFAPQTA
jgi:acyl-CoA thioester hydrolase